MNTLSIVIPHKDQTVRLGRCLGCLPSDIPTYVICGGTYAENCNKGLKLCDTSHVMFLNDDCYLNPDTIDKMMELTKHAEVVGVANILQTHRIIEGIEIFPENKEWPFRETSDPNKVHFPAGACYIFDKKFLTPYGFDTAYLNGGEDVDLFLNCVQAGLDFAYLREPVLHDYASSSGRWQHVNRNVQLLLHKYPIERLQEIKDKIK